MYDLIDVELVKKSGKGLGLSIVGRKNGSGVFISDVVPGGIAELHGGLMKGDMIITVDGKDLKNATQVQVHDKLIFLANSRGHFWPIKVIILKNNDHN